MADTPAPKVAGPRRAIPGQSTASYLGGDQLRRLADHLGHLNKITEETGWRADSMVVTFGEGSEEIVIGIRWLTGAGEYAAEIR